jgi:YegS/Rv2252/BmrU family lipid kinase
MSKKMTLIFNPASAGGKTAKVLENIIEMIKSHLGMIPKIYITQKPLEATSLARDAIKKGSTLIVAVGGDGTIQEVVNGYFDKNMLVGRACHLGILNCGTGGGLAQSLGLPRSLLEQLDIIKNGKVRIIDCGKINYFDRKDHPVASYFVNELQFGIGGTVVSHTGKLKKRLGGKLSFGFTTISSVFSHANQQLQLEIDTKKNIEGVYTGIVVANGAFTGGGMNLAPGAETDDGYFNILLMNGLSVTSRLLAFSKIYSGKHIKNGKFRYFPAKKLKVMSSEKVLFEADGELLGNLPCTVKIIPKSIPVLVAN